MPCRRFLNRLLGVSVARQGLLFAYFAATLTAEIQAAKAEGRYFEGLSDLSGSAIERTYPKPEVGPCCRSCWLIVGVNAELHAGLFAVLRLC